MPIPQEQAVEMSKELCLKNRTNLTIKTQQASEELDGLKTFIHTEDRLEETEWGILVGSNQGNKDSQGIGLEEDEKFVCTI